MNQNQSEIKKTAKKSWFSRWVEKLDKKLEQKANAKEGSCCKPKDPSKGSSCC